MTINTKTNTGNVLSILELLNKNINQLDLDQLFYKSNYSSKESLKRYLDEQVDKGFVRKFTEKVKIKQQPWKSVSREFYELTTNGVTHLNDKYNAKRDYDAETQLYNTFDKFHDVVRQLKVRYANRKTLEIENEYDVQDLLHSLLRLHFDDIRAEEGTESFGGTNSRIDFVLNKYKIGIEVKKTRESLKNAKLVKQINDDIIKYTGHASCEKIIFFVYDPDKFIDNPSGFLENYEKVATERKLNVEVIIRP